MPYTAEMRLVDELVGFIRVFRRVRGGPSPPTSLARTLRDSTHVRGAHGGMGRAGTEHQHEIVADGHERYARSFDAE